MGNGVSSKEATALVQKWDRALDDLKSLTTEHQRLAATTGAGGAAAGSGRRNTSPRLSGQDGPRRIHVPSSEDSNADDGVRLGKAGDIVIHSEAASTVSMSAVPSPSSGARAIKVSKAVAAGNRQARELLYHSYTMTADQQKEMLNRSAAAATHFAAAAVALSAIQGGKRGDPRETVVTVEDLFFAAEIPLTYLQQQSIELEELHEIVQRFIDTDTRFRGNFAVDVVHLDVAPAVGHVTRFGSRLAGENACKVTQPRLLEGVKDDLASNQAVYLVHFDPFVAQQETRPDGTDDDEEDDDDGASSAETHSKFRNLGEATPKPRAADAVDPAQYFNASMTTSKEQTTSSGSALNGSTAGGASGGLDFVTMQHANDQNNGLVTIVTGWRQKVVDTIQIAEAASFGGKEVAIYQNEIPFPALYKAMAAPSSSSGRARGYLRIYRANETQESFTRVENDPVQPFLSSELLSGNVIGHLDAACHAAAIEPLVAPHLVAVSWGLHILRGTCEGTHRHGSGLPVSDVVRTLQLPSEVYLDGDLPLDQVHMYVNEYIRLKDLHGQYTTDLVPVVVKANRSDALPSLTQHELDSILFEVTEANDDPEFPAVVTMFQYDAAVAHNALGVSTRAQWCVLAGYDRERQLARLIDGNAQAFGRSWTVSCEWLLQAITGHGYIVVRNVPRLVRRRSTARGSASLAASMRVGTAAALGSSNDDMVPPSDDAWTPRNDDGSNANRVPPGFVVPPALNSKDDDTNSTAPPSITMPPDGLPPKSPDNSPSGAGSGKPAPAPAHAPGTAGGKKVSRDQVGALRHLTSDVQRRLRIAGAHSQGLFDVEPLVPTFTYTNVPLSVTCIAAALSRLGNATRVDDVVMRSSFPFNALISRDLGLNSFHVTFDDFLTQANLASQFEVSILHAQLANQRITPVTQSQKALATVDNLIELVKTNVSSRNAAHTCVMVHFAPQRISIAGNAHPFGSYGIITGIVAADTEYVIEVADMNPNAFLRHWRVTPDVLMDAMEPSFKGHRARGLAIVRKLSDDDDALEARLAAQPKRQRPMSLAVAPFFSMFRTTISPQIYGLSLAFAQLGFHFSPDEIFYEAYLKTVRSGTRRTSQARAWRDVDVSFEVLNRNVTSKLLTELASKFLASRQERALKVEHLGAINPENFAADLQDAATPDAETVLLVTYDAEMIHGLPHLGNGTALVQSYDAEKQQVGLFDAEHTLYGLQWMCPLALLIDACDRATGHEDGTLAAVRVRKVDVPPDAEDEEDVAPEITGTFGAAAF